MITREVAVASCAKAVNSENAARFKQPATSTCARATVPEMARLRCCSSANANTVIVPSTQVPVRMENGGISSSAIFIAGQVRPQARLSPTSVQLGGQGRCEYLLWCFRRHEPGAAGELDDHWIHELGRGRDNLCELRVRGTSTR